MKNVYTVLALFGAAVCVVTCDDINREELCESGVDLTCVRDYFMRNGKCSVVTTPKNNVIYKAVYPFYAPIVDVTVIGKEMHYSDFDGDIEVFYIDKDTGNLYMSIHFDEIHLYSPDYIFIIDQDGEEPIIFKEKVNVTYDVTVTAIIPASDGITITSLEQGEYYGHLHEIKQMDIGPKYSQSTDSTVVASHEAYLSQIMTPIKELYVTKAPLDFSVYLQNYVCDFGFSPVALLRHEYDLTVVNHIIDNDSGVDKFEPCAQSNDIDKCVQDFFEEQGSCSVIRQPSDEPVFREIFKDYEPFINATLFLYNAEISGLNGKIREFYINRNTDNLVMTVDFYAYKMDIEKAELIIHNIGKPPTIAADFSKPIYNIAITAVINIQDGLTIDAVKKSFISTVFRSFSLKIGSNLVNSEDPVVKKAIEALYLNPMAVGEGIFVTEGPYCFLTYLQTRICDFGISFF